MVYGIGTDIVDIARIHAILDRHGDRFVRRILGPDEQAEYQMRKHNSDQRAIRFLATRFAAKEAFSKAIGLGMRVPMTWHTMQTMNEESGRPVIWVTGALKKFVEAQELTAHVSITDEIKYGIAFVILEKNNAQ